ncbi:MAG: hypothetical protein DRG09_02660 [Epsilonproteobacteria bacterium]|nr:MAG: hypothetical protein DRG09_02660 [Campylobacterota bacterium]
MKKLLLIGALISGSLLGLNGCGGGGGGTSSDPVTVTPPVISESSDKAAPTITLNGETEITIEQNSPYVELGATSFDDFDGNISVSISGEVITSVPDVYLVKYSATDLSGNVGSAERIVTVTVPSDQNTTKIDVLAIYSAGVDTLYAGDVETRLSHLFAVSNMISTESRAGMEIVLVGAQEYAPLNDSSSSSDVLIQVTNDTNVTQMRDAISADEVFIYRPYANDGMCGLAWINTPLDKAYAVAHITVDCSSETTAHEFGHNLGIDHSHGQGSIGGIYPYSYGHAVDDLFGTVMTYADLFNAEYLLVYSNPALDCKGEACGIEESYEGEADAVKTISQTKLSISGFN